MAPGQTQQNVNVGNASDTDTSMQRMYPIKQAPPLIKKQRDTSTIIRCRHAWRTDGTIEHGPMSFSSHSPTWPEVPPIHGPSAGNTWQVRRWRQTGWSTGGHGARGVAVDHRHEPHWLSNDTPCKAPNAPLDPLKGTPYRFQKRMGDERPCARPCQPTVPMEGINGRGQFRDDLGREEAVLGLVPRHGRCRYLGIRQQGTPGVDASILREERLDVRQKGRCRSEFPLKLLARRLPLFPLHHTRIVPDA